MGFKLLRSAASAAATATAGQRRFCVSSLRMPDLVLTNAQRGMVLVEGPDAVTMLQGLASNDVRLLTPNAAEGERKRVIYSGFMNSKGRLVCDAFVHDLSGAEGGAADADVTRLLVDVDKAVAPALTRHLKVHRFQSQCKVSAVEDGAPDAPRILLSAAASPDLHSDPRFPDFAFDPSHDPDEPPLLPLLSRRLLLPSDAPPAAPSALAGADAAAFYAVYRMLTGLPEGAADVPSGSALPLESNLDFLGGVSFSKGCYIGQELTARSHHRGLTRKRLLPVIISRDCRVIDPYTLLLRDLPPLASLSTTAHGAEDGTLVRAADGDAAAAGTGSSAGVLRSSVALSEDLSLGLALLKLEHVDWQQPGIYIKGDGRYVVPIPPRWWPEEDEEDQ
eukprot:Rhum_TRINITY_DN15362_c8_g1::Rhum_TRINITY_DN15362_c8_g1_i1::g.153345::m.153345